MEKNFKIILLSTILVSILISSSLGAVFGFFAGTKASSNISFMQMIGLEEIDQKEELEENNKETIVVEEESQVINVVEDASPAVVSIIVTKDLPIIERYYERPQSGDLFDQFFGDFFDFGTPQYRQKGTEKKEVGGGTGFFVSDDGYLISNKHVVEDEDAEYTVLLNDETKYTAQVLARDPINDIAVLKVETQDKKFDFVELGDSSVLKVGQSVVAIGNALAEFRNTVSTGVISGLSRSIVAGGFGSTESLTNVIQTDASINPGNSGGPLLNLAGQVIGINTAIAQGAQNIGFAIPVNEIKNVYESVKENGRIVRPWLGIRYVQISDAIKEKNQLSVDYGALILRGEDRLDLAVIPGSPADKAGLTENDIILEVDGVKVDSEHPLNKLVAGKKVGDEVKLKILHKGEENEVKVVLEEMK